MPYSRALEARSGERTPPLSRAAPALCGRPHRRAREQLARHRASSTWHHAAGLHAPHRWQAGAQCEHRRRLAAAWHPVAAGRRWCTCCTPGRTGLNAHLWLDGEVDVDRHELPTDVFAGSTRRAAGRDGSVETRELYAWRCLRRPVHCGLCAAQLHTCTSTQKRQIPDTRISQPHTPSHTHRDRTPRETPRDQSQRGDRTQHTHHSPV